MGDFPDMNKLTGELVGIDRVKALLRKRLLRSASDEVSICQSAPLNPLELLKSSPFLSAGTTNSSESLASFDCWFPEPKSGRDIMLDPISIGSDIRFELWFDLEFTWVPSGKKWAKAHLRPNLQFPFWKYLQGNLSAAKVPSKLWSNGQDLPAWQIPCLKNLQGTWLKFLLVLDREPAPLVTVAVPGGPVFGGKSFSKASKSKVWPLFDLEEPEFLDELENPSVRGMSEDFILSWTKSLWFAAKNAARFFSGKVTAGFSCRKTMIFGLDGEGDEG